MLNKAKSNMSFIKGLILVTFSFLMVACNLTPEQKVLFDPEKAAMARFRLGMGYLAQADESPDNIKNAHYNLNLAKEYSPNNPNIMLGLALFDQKVGEYQEADMIYQQIIKMEPENGLFIVHYGSFLCATNRYTEAKSRFKSVINLYSPQWKADSLEQLGFCAIQYNDVNEANEAFTKLFQYDNSKRKEIIAQAKLYQEHGYEHLARYLIEIANQK